MSLLRFIYHAPVGAPTYFDLLPVDGLRCFIIPFIGWEDRIHLNMLTPPGDRTPPAKIPKDRIAAHQLHLSFPEVQEKARASQRLGSTRGVSAQRRIEAVLEALRAYNKGHNILIASYHQDNRTVLQRRLEEFSRPEGLRAIRLRAQRSEMQVAVQVLLEKLAANPYSHDVKPKKWLRERVTQNETSIMYAEEREGGYRVFRRQGDIYSVVE
jgi:hypothetical protein